MRAASREAITGRPAEAPVQPLGGAEVCFARMSVSEQNPSAQLSLQMAGALLQLDRNLGET